MEDLRKLLDEMRNAMNEIHDAMDELLMEYGEISLMRNLQIQYEAQWN